MVAKRVLITAIVAFLGVGVSAGWAEEGPFSVRLNPRLELESAEPAVIEGRIRGPLQRNEWMLPPTDYVKFSEDPWRSDRPIEDLIVDRVRPATCAALNALVDRGYEPWDEPVYLDDCKALRLLKRARPSRESFVRTLTMSVELVDVLPAMIDSGAIFDRLCDEYVAMNKGIPWSTYDEIVEVSVIDRFAMDVKAQHPKTWEEIDAFESVGGGWTRLETLAWGDFDGDGVEDMLISSSSHAMNWNLTDGYTTVARDSYGDVYMVSRDSPVAVLHVIDAESHLTPRLLDYEPCDYP